ncbi:Rid family hydrolase [Herbiconiux moechotypicola]|uniref:RidA family protein n=1 Tax=Herbiconiux moechotypicola TaxID=637393 RepID=A0ABP5QEP8_9MICO|nr:Rid family hydrolase [Herbiconiux moechotypicola]MCS5729921.1 Rid family hydrolase [Herbiconiux moechotypicola]
MSTRPESIIPSSQRAVAEQNGYSPAIRLGGQLIVSGQIGVDAEGVAIPDPEGQIVAAFDALGEVLAEAGMGFSDIVELKTYHTEFETLGLFLEVKARYITGPVFPAWTILGVALAAPGSIIEIGAIAYRPEEG